MQFAYQIQFIWELQAFTQTVQPFEYVKSGYFLIIKESWECWKYENRCQNWDFSYPDHILVGILDFPAKSGESRQNQDGWIVC